MATVNPTADEYIDILPSDLGASVYVEIIIIDPVSGEYAVGANTACGRPCGSYNSLSFIRDIYTPDYNGVARTVRSLLNVKGKRTADYTPYYRDYNTNSLSAAGYDDEVVNRLSIIFVHSDISSGKLAHAMNHIGTHREVLPSRMPN